MGPVVQRRVDERADGSPRRWRRRIDRTRAVAATAGGPSLGVLVTVFHRSRFYRDALRSVAEQLGPVPSLEIVVVHSPDVTIEVPAQFKTRGWSVAVVRSAAVGEGPFLADGLASLSTEFVVPLDDDDLWAPGRLAAVAATLRGLPTASYYHNGQVFVGADGSPVSAAAARRHLRRFAGSPTGVPRRRSASELRKAPGALARWGSIFNNSSVAIRRSVLVECEADLRSTTRLIDSFMFYAGAASGGDLVFDPAAHTLYRIHAWNRSRGARTLGPFETTEASQTREGRLASLAAMRRMAERRGASWLLPWVGRDRAVLRPAGRASRGGGQSRGDGTALDPPRPVPSLRGPRDESRAHRHRVGSGDGARVRESGVLVGGPDRPAARRRRRVRKTTAATSAAASTKEA